MKFGARQHCLASMAAPKRFSGHSQTDLSPCCRKLDSWVHETTHTAHTLRLLLCLYSTPSYFIWCHRVRVGEEEPFPSHGSWGWAPTIKVLASWGGGLLCCAIRGHNAKRAKRSGEREHIISWGFTWQWLTHLQDTGIYLCTHRSGALPILSPLQVLSLNADTLRVIL